MRGPVGALELRRSGAPLGAQSRREDVGTTRQIEKEKEKSEGKKKCGVLERKGGREDTFTYRARLKGGPQVG